MTRLFITLTMLCLFQSANSQVVTWIGATSNDWSVATNWDSLYVPGAINTAVIPTGTVIIPAGYDAEVESVIINNGSELTVDGTLDVEGYTNRGIVNRGCMTNNNAITLANGDDEAIDNEGTFFNYGTITFIGNVGTDGVFNSGILPADTAFFHNYGSLLFPPCTVFNAITCDHPSLFINHPNALIDIDSCGDSRGLDFSGTEELAIMINHGTIDIKHTGVTGEGTMVNHGSLTVDPQFRPNTGFWSLHFTNTETGNVVVKNIASTALSFFDSLFNYGTFLVDSTGNDGISMIGSHFENHGDFELRRIGRIGISATDSKWWNETGSFLKITQTNKMAFDLFGAGAYMYNNGEIDIDSAGLVPGGGYPGHGLWVRVLSSFVNDTLGLMEVSNCAETGIFINSPNKSENFGEINIDHCDLYGIHTQGTDAFYNRPSGNMHFSDIMYGGVTVAGGFGAGGAKCVNQGYMFMEASCGFGFDNHFRTLINDTCGTIITHAKFKARGTTTNYGFIHSRGNEAHELTSGSNQNYGVLEDLNGLVTSGWTNHKIMVSPKSSTGCASDNIANVLDLGSLADFTVYGFYTDSLMSTSAGTWDDVSNSLSLNSDGAGKDILYIHIENDLLNCLDTAQIKITSTCPITCPDDTFIWTGCGSNANWLTSDNWSKVGVPGLTDEVLITGSPTGGMFPFISSPVTISKLDLSVGAHLALKPGGLLNVVD